MEKIYLTLSEIVRMFDSPKECCDDYKLGVYISSKEGTDILKRRQRYSFSVKVFHAAGDNFQKLVADIDPRPSITIPECEELPHLGFVHDAEPFKKDVYDRIVVSAEEHGLDWKGIFAKDYKGPRTITKSIIVMRDPDDELLGEVEVHLIVK